eukprot:6464275-Amphidinium_carterae.1
MAMVFKMCARCTIVAVQEAHAVSLADFAEGELPSSHFAFLSSAGRSVGGILVLIKKSAVKDVEVQWIDMVRGRVCAVLLKKRGYLRKYVLVHLTPSQGQSWESLLEVATEGVTEDRASVTFVVGATNVAHELGEQISIATGEPSLQVGPRAHRWKVATRGMFEVHAGLTHVNKARGLFTAIDRCLTNLPGVVMEVLNARSILLGGWRSPPADSDHWPVCFFFDLQRDCDLGYAKWTALHPDYAIAVQAWKYELGVDLASSSTGLRDIYTIIENSVAQVESIARAFDVHPECQLAAMLHTVHACLMGQARKVSDLLNRSSWGIAPSLGLDVIVQKLLPMVKDMNEQAARLGEEKEHATNERNKAGWQGFMYQAWRRMKVTPPVSVHTGEQSCDDEFAEVRALVAHWSSVFDRDEAAG